MDLLGFFGIYFNVFKSCVGTGILIYPVLYGNHGILLTILFASISCLFCLLSCCMYINVTKQQKKLDPGQNIPRSLYGCIGETIYNTVVLIKCYLTTVVYIKVLYCGLEDLVKINIYRLNQGFTHKTANTVLIILMSFIITIICILVSLERIRFLRSASFVGVLGIFVLLVGTFSILSNNSYSVLAKTSLSLYPFSINGTNPWNIIPTFGQFIFGFNSHQNTIAIAEDSDLSTGNIQFAYTLAYISTAICYLSFGYLVASSIECPTNTNVLSQLPETKTKIFVLIAYYTIVAISIVLQMFSTVETIHKRTRGILKSKLPISVFLFTLSTMFVAKYRVSMELLATLISTTFSLFICFVFPTAYQFKIGGFSEYQIHMCTSIISVVMGLYTFYYSFIDIISSR